MAIPSFSAFHDEGINLEGLLEILSPENNLVLADDMMVSDGNGIILRVSETYEKNFGFAHDSIVGKSAFDLEADGTFTPCITAEVIRRRKKISATQTINHTHKNVMTVGIPLFDANGELKYAVCFNTVSMEQINSIQRNYRRMQDSLQHYSQEIAELRTRATSTNLLFKSAPMQRLWTLMQNTANTRANILITGETGVGKSAIAKAIHKMSNRANGPFIEVNCAVLHENLIESELFGYEKHPFTGVDYVDFYKGIIEDAGAQAEIVFANRVQTVLDYTDTVICCDIHTRNETRDVLQAMGKTVFTLADVMSAPVNGSGYHDKYGMLGSNKATEEKLKLFPRNCQPVVDSIQARIAKERGLHVEVMVYGDGAFKDPVGGIWELADPVVSPAYTAGLEGTPNELKLKYLADNDFAALSGEALRDAIKGEIQKKDGSLVGKMAAQGTTPRRLTDLIGSLCDLTSGSGDKGTPIVHIQGYFDNYTTE